MKVAITHPYSWPEVRRGAERIIVETARSLAGRGHDVTIISAGRSAGRSVEEGVRVHRVRRHFEDGVRHERWFGWRIIPLLVAGRYDVVHSFMPPDAVAAIRTRRLAGHRALYDEMGIPVREWWPGQPHFRNRLRIAKDVDVYACMSQFAVDALERTSRRRGAVLPGGVRLTEFQPPPARDPRPTLLFSGAVDEPRKGVAMLLDALAVVAEQEPGVQLWLSGPGDAEALLAAAPNAARERTTVLPLGEPSDQARRYGQAWATVLPSVNESFGMVLIESLACGTPLVVADQSAPPEQVTADTGSLCVPGDAGSLAEAILRTLDLARRPGTVAACRAHASQYDWDAAIAPLLEDLYTRELGTPAASV